MVVVVVVVAVVVDGVFVVVVVVVVVVAVGCLLLLCISEYVCAYTKMSNTRMHVCMYGGGRACLYVRM